MLNPDEIDLSVFPPGERVVVEEYLRRKTLRRKGQSFIDYVAHIAPWFVFEECHIAICEKLQAVADGEIDRLMIFIAPRTGKSQLASSFFPTYFIGNAPTEQIMQVGHSATISEGFGREARNILNTPEFQEVFPETRLSKDSRSVSAWATTKNGKYSTAGVDTGIAGKGFALGVLDDLLNEKTALSQTAKEYVWNWYGPGFYSRKMPRNAATGKGSAIVVINTRWAVDDISGRLLAQRTIDANADEWDVLKIPAILDEASAKLLTRISHDPRYRKYLSGDPITYAVGDSYSPRRFPLKDLLRSKANMSARAWSALYMQSPVVEEGGVLQAGWWKLWPDSKELPDVTYILQSYDVAAETDVHNDNTARTTWGVFKRPSDGRMCAMVLEYTLHKKDFPDLLENALESFQSHKPDRTIIEKASSGIPLYQEYRKRGIAVSAIKPIGSKYSRADAASIPLSQGVVYYPDRAWAKKLIEVCAQFPAGPEDDTVDSTTQALTFLRKMFMLETPADEEDEDEDDDTPIKRSYATRRSRLPVAA
jgi:predicted phage terminase large subunit-like protein